MTASVAHSISILVTSFITIMTNNENLLGNSFGWNVPAAACMPTKLAIPYVEHFLWMVLGPSSLPICGLGTTSAPSFSHPSAHTPPLERLSNAFAVFIDNSVPEMTRLHFCACH